MPDLYLNLHFAGYEREYGQMTKTIEIVAENPTLSQELLHQLFVRSFDGLVTIGELEHAISK